MHAGLADPAVTLADPAIGTGTFVLGILHRIAETVTADEGEGAVKAAVNAAVNRLLAFELQLGPFAVAQLRILAEIVTLTGAPPTEPLRMFVTDTLSNPYVQQEWLPTMYKAIGESRQAANKIKREEPITVVMGNPPYKEKAKGRGGWIEGETKDKERSAPLAAWMPPREWGVGAHAKHLRNLYIYFWRWATWKVFDHHPDANQGIVCFITVAGFLSGPGFQRMRDYLRRTCDDIWVIDCSPEGHQPEVNTRIFQGVQQPVCIVLASRSTGKGAEMPATVRILALPAGHRTEKFAALGMLSLGSGEWVDCPSDWRAPFLPASTGAWVTFPALDDFFADNGSGVMPGRTWIIAPDSESLHRRWHALVNAPASAKEQLFHPHLRDGKLGDKHSKKVVKVALAGYEARRVGVADDRANVLLPTRYGYRSFDRQWIVPDSRLINQPNPELWAVRSDHQVFLTALSRTSPSSGPALSFTGLIPDLDHYKGSFGGRVYPLWRAADATVPNVLPELLSFLSEAYGHPVGAEDVMAYIAAVAAHPGFTARFHTDLSTPGLRIPLTADRETVAAAAELGRTVIWLHTFDERMADPSRGRPAGPPRVPEERRPRIPRDGAIPEDPEGMPNAMGYDSAKRRLLVGGGYVENVEPAVWSYQVSGKQVLLHWFSYRKKDRERPLIGDRRPPSPLGLIQPDHWLAEYTTELINVLNVLDWLVSLEPAQAALLDRVCSGPTIPVESLRAARTLERPTAAKGKAKASEHPELFSLSDH